MLSIIVPASGRGSRFVAKGYKEPKPLIPVNGKPMLTRVIENVRPSSPHQFTVLMQKDHAVQGGVAGIYDCRLMLIDQVTEGAACTVLLAREFLTDDPLMIVNSDQLLDWSVDQFLATAGPWDGAIVTFPASDPKWSYAKSEGMFVSEVAEKRPISGEATCGIYYWKRGTDFSRCAEQMIAQNKRHNNEFYVAPVFNELISSGGKVVTYPIRADAMHGLGTPEDLERYLDGIRQPLAQSA